MLRGLVGSEMCIRDRLMASRALAAAIAGGGDAEDIRRAERQMVRAAEDLAQGRPDKAIQHYSRACAYAVEALG